MYQWFKIGMNTISSGVEGELIFSGIVHFDTMGRCDITLQAGEGFFAVFMNKIETLESR